MKKYLFLLLIVGGLISCEDDCQTCTVIVEDNAVAAENACFGFPSDYPNGYFVFAEFTDVYCDENLDDVLAQDGEDLVELCSGIFISRITTVICE